MQVIKTKKMKLGADHPDTLTSMAYLAVTYQNQGRWDEAEELQVQLVKTSKTKLGADHPDTLTIMANLALTWKKHGRDAEALKLMEECVTLQTRIIGPNHPDTLSSSTTLARWQTEERGITGATSDGDSQDEARGGLSRLSD